jgi:uncharacterized protein YdhG (YjbR/CyaY superfamily)
MVKSDTTTVDAYLAELPDERREVIERVRETILANLPDGYEEAMAWGMISYQIPLARYPDTYNGKPLAYISLAAQKRHYALYLMGVYQDAALEAELKAGFAAAGKSLDMGKSCLRFRKLEDVPLDIIAKVVASVSPDAFIARYEASRTTSR